MILCLMHNEVNTRRPSLTFKDELLTHHSGGRYSDEKDFGDDLFLVGNILFLIANSTQKKTPCQMISFFKLKKVVYQWFSPFFGKYDPLIVELRLWAPASMIIPPQYRV